MFISNTLSETSITFYYQNVILFDKINFLALSKNIAKCNTTEHLFDKLAILILYNNIAIFHQKLEHLFDFVQKYEVLNKGGRVPPSLQFSM